MNRHWKMMMRAGAVGLLAAVVALGTGCDREELDAESVSGTEAGGGGDAFHQYISMDVEGGDVEPGEIQTGTIEIQPGDGLYINLDFRWGLELDDVDGVDIEERKIAEEQMELSEERARIPFAYKIDEEGEYTVTATGDFSVCNDEICHVGRDEDIDFVVNAGM